MTSRGQSPLPDGFIPVPRPEPMIYSTRPLMPWHIRLAWRIWGNLTWWPWQVRQLKRAGFRRTGWRQWESP